MEPWCMPLARGERCQQGQLGCHALPSIRHSESGVTTALLYMLHMLLKTRGSEEQAREVIVLIFTDSFSP